MESLSEDDEDFVEDEIFDVDNSGLGEVFPVSFPDDEERLGAER